MKGKIEPEVGIAVEWNNNAGSKNNCILLTRWILYQCVLASMHLCICSDGAETCTNKQNASHYTNKYLFWGVIGWRRNNSEQDRQPSRNSLQRPRKKYHSQRFSAEVQEMKQGREEPTLFQ
uniref:Uncharacterized protein n=1 Tax=Salix viminalis TaxID=40686 RepID=A0A6N2NEK9_SALVM